MRFKFILILACFCLCFLNKPHQPIPGQLLLDTVFVLIGGQFNLLADQLSIYRCIFRGWEHMVYNAWVFPYQIPQPQTVQSFEQRIHCCSSGHNYLCDHQVINCNILVVVSQGNM